ncbi:hypothetical protein C8P68_101280 [Mucilaginibacter yixingensis]|uniref:Uncharacterized protein n=1 Tax=Mucilaginibacter yixingensis TaxID=1295612 RepID=A0A2T5JF54_9SPHI|nr:hypothetical protein [Mucilaginibacter yixingensis]PTR01049.1 hypothetical protein C8P68_101280 [Mucilaginibacter yixingensis]
MKKLLILCLLVCGAVVAHAQSMTFYSMADMVRLSAGEVDNILVNTGKFKVNDKQIVKGQLLTSYQTIDRNKTPIKGETLVTGAYNTTNSGEHLHTITYKSIYPEYIYNLIKQIQGLGYHNTLKGADQVRSIYIFDSNFYHVTVLMMRDGSVNSVEIRQKELGIEP